MRASAPPLRFVPAARASLDAGAARATAHDRPRGRGDALPVSHACVLVASIVAIFVLVGCSFDASDLDERNACRTAADCLQGPCVAGRCESPFAPDASAPSDTSSDSDAAAPACPGGSANACGGCGPIDVVIGSPCAGPCSRWVCDGVDQTVCDEQPNACGGCDTLPGVPGQPCEGSACRRWTCDGTALVCPPGPNACGGCETLPVSAGSPCNSCGGRWTCDGTEDLVCDGGSTDVCGGCSAASGEPGTLCACPGVDAERSHRWFCTSDALTCGDNDDTRATALALPPAEAGDPPVAAPTAVIALRGDVDWYVMPIDSPNAGVPASTRGRPAVRVRGNRPVELCAAWEWTDSRRWSPACIEGADARERDGLTWCCLDNEGDSLLRVAQATADGSVFRADAAGRLLVRVAVGRADACAEYALEVLP